MHFARNLACTTLLGLAACGGSSSTPAPPAPNLFVGALNITGTMPAGNTNCIGIHTVTFTAGGASTQEVNMIAGGCVDFVAGDAGSYRPASYGTVACNELNAPAVISGGNEYLAGPMDGPRNCNWQDTLHPPSGGGGGGGGGTH